MHTFDGIPAPHFYNLSLCFPIYIDLITDKLARPLQTIWQRVDALQECPAVMKRRINPFVDLRVMSSLKNSWSQSKVRTFD
jgi:hypothetical protein